MGPLEGGLRLVRRQLQGKGGSGVNGRRMFGAGQAIDDFSPRAGGRAQPPTPQLLRPKFRALEPGIFGRTKFETAANDGTSLQLATHGIIDDGNGG